MRAVAIMTFLLSGFAALAQTPEEISKKVAEALAMRPGPERTARFERLASECDKHPVAGDSCANAYDWYAASLRSKNKTDAHLVPLTDKALKMRESGPHSDTSLAVSLELAGFALWDSGDQVNSKGLFDRAFELHKAAVASIGAEPQTPAPMDSINPQVRRDDGLAPSVSGGTTDGTTSVTPGGTTSVTTSGTTSVTPGASGASGRAGVLMTPPSVISKIDPAYTEMARVFKISGTVQLDIVVGKSGVAESIRLVQGLGLGLDEQAARSVRIWRFRSGTRAGQPVAVRAKVEVNFRLL